MTCLTSFKAREALRQMAKTNPEFWAELSVGGADNVQLPDATETLPEDVEHDTELEDQDSDDSDLSLETLITALTKDVPDTVGSRKSGKLASLTDAENVDLVPEMLEEGNSAAEGGRGKRNKVANQQYQGFWRHHDKDDWNDDSLLPVVG
jgi:hypothetical protein